MNPIKAIRAVYEKIDDVDDEVFIIPEHMKEGIRQANQDIKNGDFIILEEFEKRYEKYLKD